MKSFSNTYIFIFSAIMVTIVAILLSFVAMKLKPIQENNIRIEKMQNILNSVHIESSKKDAEKLFEKYVDTSYVVNFYGQEIPGKKALEIDMKKEAAKIEEIRLLREKLSNTATSPFRRELSKLIELKDVDKGQVDNDINRLTQERQLPVFVIKKGTETYYVVPVQGKGLWGPVWGFVSLDLGEVDAEGNEVVPVTIYGAVFDHKSETPGLGAEIAEDKFEQSFNGKQLYDGKEFKSVKVVKGGIDPDNPDPYGVDAISGGTITSTGVEDMLKYCLVDYDNFINNKR